MKCLGILAGPRKGHATDALIDAVLSGLKEGGGEIEKISLYDYAVKPCAGCCTCQQNKPCVIDDDQRIILAKMDAADVVVFGSPAYWSNVTSEAKKFMDRSADFFRMTGFGPRRTKPTPGAVVLVTTCGAPFPFTHLMGIVPGALRAMKVFFGRMNARIYTVYAGGMLDPAASRPSKKTLAKACALGRRIALARRS